MENEQTECNGEDKCCKSESCEEKDSSSAENRFCERGSAEETSRKEIEDRADKELKILKLKARAFDLSSKIQGHQHQIRLCENDIKRCIEEMRKLGGN